jgi:glucose/arabinose dehydrogenase
MRQKTLVSLIAVGLAALHGAGARAEAPDVDYVRLCAGCHGASFRPTGATPVGDPEALAEAIRSGSPQNGMPAFGARLSPSRVQALARLIRAHVSDRGMLGLEIEAESLDRSRSTGYVISRAETRPETQYVGYFDERSSLCYPDVDLTGARSITFTYARGPNDDVGRFAILAGDGKQVVNLGENLTSFTGGWETYERRSVGLARELRGRHLLCFLGLVGGGIFNLDRFSLSAAAAEHDGLTFKVRAEPPRLVTAAGSSFALEKVADAAAELWSMAFLPDGAILATQRNGQLLLFRNGQRPVRIDETPAVWEGGQGGLFAVKPHPEHARNGWIYLSFADPGDGNASSMTRIVRGRIEGTRWVDQQDVYRAPKGFYSSAFMHYGSRLAFADGYVFFGVGDRQRPELAQDLAFPYGKIHRLHDDGRVPADNPFVGRDGALPTIWSYGHRNPQGMTTHPRTGGLWSAEHGPAGGDEVNLLRKGANYGWARVSFGRNYDGTPVGDSPWADGVEPPIHHYTPSIGISQLEFYTADGIPDWRDQLLVASLGGEQLHLLRLRGEQVMNDRIVLEGVGRIRDVAVGPDGFVYLLLNHVTAGIYRLKPAT